MTAIDSIAGPSWELSPSKWVVWMQGFEQIETADAEAKFWAHEAFKKMKDIMFKHDFTADRMENWDPKNKTVHTGIRQDPRYAHIFNVPQKASK